jgi:hypothetical protein
MYLQMQVGNLVVDRYRIDYSEMNTIYEKLLYHTNIVNDMMQHHQAIIKMLEKPPLFFIERVASKMNNEGFIIDETNFNN